MRNYFSVPLSTMTKGVNRFEAEAAKGQASEASDVIADDGYLRRRDSFTSIASGVPHYMPKGSVFVMTSNAAVSEAIADLRVGYGTLSGTSYKRLYVGTPEVFDGISFEALSAVPSSLSESISLRVYYNTDADVATWSEVPHTKDKTRKRIGNYLSSLCQEGQVSWHSGDLTGWTAASPTIIWGDTTLNSDYLGDLTTLYWVRIDIVKTSDSTATNVPATLTTVKPGIRAFQLQPVNGLFPVRLGERQTVVVCNDRNRTGGASSIRPYEPGSQIGIIHNENEQTNIMRLVSETTDEGLGFYGRVQWPAWTSSATGVASTVSRSLETNLHHGFYAAMRKTDDTYTWMHDVSDTEPRFGQFRGSPLVQALVPQSGSTAKIVKLLASALTPQANQYDHCRLRVTTAAGSSVLGEECEIWRTYTSGLYTYVQVHGDLTAAPTDSDVVAIISPHARLVVKPFGGVAEDLEANTQGTLIASTAYADDGTNLTITAASHNISPGQKIRFDTVTATHDFTIPREVTAVTSTTVVVASIGTDSKTEAGIIDTASPHAIIPATGEYARVASSNITNKDVNFELSRECRWALDAGRRYSGTYATATKKLILTNGVGPLLEVDGERLRPLAADTTSETAKAIAGEIKEREESETEFDLHASSYLRERPPYGDFVVDYRGRIVVGRRDTNEIIYNWPGKPDIWPVGYIFLVRDSENNPITGMSTLYDKLIVFTATSIFECGPPSALGHFTVRPASQGIGFTSHWAVAKISSRGTSALLGPGTDGVYMYTGAEPVAVLDDWSRLLEGGVNRGRLDDAVAGVSFTKNLYFLAVPAAGSEINNRVLVFDFVRKNWWVWTSAHGITSIATDYDESGAERVLFGTNTGHIQVLRGGITDDGQTITGTARTIPVPAFGEREASFVATLGAYGDLGLASAGTPNTVTVKSYTDERDEANTSTTIKLNAGRGSADVTTWAANEKYGDDRFLRKRSNLPPGTKGNTISVEISGTKRWKMRDLVLMARRLGRRGR